MMQIIKLVRKVKGICIRVLHIRPANAQSSFARFFILYGDRYHFRIFGTMVHLTSIRS